MARNDQRNREGVLTIDDFRAAGTGDERRRELRIPCEKHIGILPCASEKDWAFKRVGLYDCSPRGLGLVSEEPMKPGEQFLVKLRVGQMKVLIYTVRHCVPADARHWKIGAEFSGVVGSPDACDPDALISALLNATNEQDAALQSSLETTTMNS